MKWIKFLFIPLILLGLIGYAVFYFGSHFASEKLMDAVTTELESTGELEGLRQEIESDPELKSFLEEAALAHTDKLPFSTKEEATRVLINKIGITKLNNIRVQIQEGSATKEEILQEVQSQLSEEELLAIKVIVYKELYGE